MLACSLWRCRSPVVRISQTVSVVGNGVLAPRVAAFSSRGPSPNFPGIIKVKGFSTYNFKIYDLAGF
jgi:hypothetical protein